MNAPVTIPEPIKEAVKRLTDDPKFGCKVTAAQAGVDRKTLYNLMRYGLASERTIRKIRDKFQLSPHSPSNTATLA